jgi:hypothetical protein
MKFHHLICLSLLSLLAGAGCSTNNPLATGLGATPSPAKSEYLRTEGGGFVLKRGESRAFESCRYVVSLAPARQLANQLYLRTRFENPADAASPLVVDSEAAPGIGTFTVESPPVRGLRARRSYKVETLIFDSPERTRQIGQHIQYVQSLVAF